MTKKSPKTGPRNKAGTQEERSIAAATEFAGRRDPDPAHAAHVVKNALELFDLTRDLHALGGHERLLLHLAALMHDAGYRLDPARHHKASRDLVLLSGIEGLSREELMVVACLARYHRKNLPNPKHKVYSDLDEEKRRVVDKLAALLRIADGLDRSHGGTVETLTAERDEGVFRLRVSQTSPIEEDLDAARRKGNLFERVFGVRLEVTGP